jgi:hypothetical protein
MTTLPVDGALTSGGASPFAVTAPPSLTLAPDRTGTTTFTVTNLTGRPVKARLIPKGANGAENSWVSVVGPTEVPMGVAATITVDLRVVVPEAAPGGKHLLGLEVVAEDDTETVTGQSVAFTASGPQAPAMGTKTKRRWLRILLMVLGSLLALIGLVVVIVIVVLIASN